MVHVPYDSSYEYVHFPLFLAVSPVSRRTSPKPRSVFPRFIYLFVCSPFRLFDAVAFILYSPLFCYCIDQILNSLSALFNYAFTYISFPFPEVPLSSVANSVTNFQTVVRLFFIFATLKKRKFNNVQIYRLPPCKGKTLTCHSLFTHYYRYCELSTDCGSAHIYETPVLLYSSELSTSSSGGTSFSSQSVESDLTSSTEVDSGYSSSVDIRRLNSLTGDNSPEQQKANFKALYENTSIRKQDAKSTVYELMSPPVGQVSSPIPIPNQGTGQPRYSKEQWGTKSSPLSTDQKCPLDFSNLVDQEFSVGKPNSPSLSRKISTSLPSSSVVQYQDKTQRLSKTVSPPTGKRSPLESSVGEAFAQENVTFLTRVGGDKLNDVSSSKAEEEDIYEDLSRPCAAVPAFPLEIGGGPPSSRTSLKANNAHSYENHRISVKEQSTEKREPREEQNCQHEVDDQNKVRCNASYLLQNDHQLRDVRSNTWPTQQNYDNHKLKDADIASSSGSCFYDNHKLRTSETNCRSSDAYCDNWKIKNEACDSSEASYKVTLACYENVKLQAGKTAANKEEHSQEGAASYEQDKETSSNKARTAEQRYENYVLNSKHTSHGNFTPNLLHTVTLESNQKSFSNSLYENCEITGDKKESQEEGTLGLTIPRHQDKNDRKLWHSLPTNCHCVEVVPDELDGSVRMILEKRSPPSLTRVGSADAITVDTDKDDPLSVRLTCDSGDNLDVQDHPVPPPRWKRIARMKRTQSLVGSSQERWEMAVSPELATVLSRRWNRNLASVCATSSQDANSVSDPQKEALQITKPALPPRANKNSVVVAKPRSTRTNAYENFALPNKPSEKETCLPELPPKIKRCQGNGTVKNGSLSSRAMHYENVVGLNGFHVVGNKNVQPQLESDSPPPLPKKLSQTKAPPLIPCRPDLEQKC